MKIVILYLTVGAVAWLGLTTFEYVCARILAPGFGLSVPAFSAFGWVSFFCLIVYGGLYGIKEILS